MLLADDHLAMRALTADVLGGECFIVGAVGDGRELLAEAERLHPDVIVLDTTIVALYLKRRLWPFTALNSWTGGLPIGLNSWKHCT